MFHSYTVVDLLLLRLFPTLRVHGVRWDTRHDQAKSSKF